MDFTLKTQAGSWRLPRHTWRARLLLALWSAVCCFWSGPLHASSLSAQSHALLAQIRDQAEAGRLDEAARMLDGFFLQHDEQHAYAYELGGYVLLRAGKFAQAVRLLEKGREIHPANLSIAISFGEALARSGQDSRAARAFLDAYDLSAGARGDLAVSAAGLLSGLGDRLAAAQALSRALDGREAKKEWFVFAGQVFLGHGDWKQAVSVLTAGVGRFSEDRRLWRLLADAYHGQGQQDRAAAARAIALRLAPDDAELAREFARQVAFLGTPVFGREVLLADFAGREEVDRLAHGLAMSGNLPQALALVEQALALEPRPERWLWKGDLLQRLGRFEEAGAVYQELSAKPGAARAEAMSRLGLLAWREGRWEQARDWLRQAAAADREVRGRVAAMLEILDQVAADRNSP